MMVIVSEVRMREIDARMRTALQRVRCAIDESEKHPMAAIEDLFKEVKSKYGSKLLDKKAVGPGHGKVLARDDNWFITDLPGKWKADYERRKEQYKTGYFSSINTPYKAFANYKNAEVSELLEDALSLNLTKQTIHFQSHSRSNRLLMRAQHDYDDGSDMIAIYDATKRKKNLPQSTTAGLDLISRDLGAHTRTLQDVKAGSCVRESLEREAHRQGVLQAIKAPKMVFQKGHVVAINKPCTYLPPMLPTASSKICLLEAPTKAMINPGGDGEEEVVNRIKKMLRPLDGKEEEEHYLKALFRKNFFAKVKSIHAILCCLHNIKNKDLRRYKPLSFSTVKTLANRPLLLYKEQQHHLYTGSLVPHHHWSNLQCTYQAQPEQKLPRPSFSLWEDILLLHEHDVWHSPAPASTDIQTPTKRQHKSLPAWKRKVKLGILKESWKPDFAKRLANRIKAFHQFKSEIGQKVHAALEEKEQLRERTMVLNMQHYECGAVREKCFPEMRGKTYQLRWAEKKKDLEKPEWFILLEEEVSQVFGEDGLESQGFEALKCLKQFQCISSETIHYVIQKLCLLAMSLPAHYLCTEQVILAFQFVCEFFLKVSPKLIEQLRGIRQLPSVIQLHPPDILFGAQIV